MMHLIQCNGTTSKSNMNPADNVSRGMNVNEFLRNDRWSKGPEFLWEANEKWSLPQDVEFKISGDDKEVTSKHLKHSRLK